MSRSGTVARVLALAAVWMAVGESRAQRTDLSLAPLRDPQVTVQGSGLRSYLDSVGESIDPTSEQVDADLITLDLSNTPTFTIQLELALRTGPGSIGLYNGHDAAPVLYEVFPAEAVAGWFAVISYRTSPVRAVVNLFDDLASFRSQRTYLGANRNGIGFFIAGPQGTFHSQDHRNPGSEAQALFFRGTGPNRGQAWLAFESDGALPDPADFDDAVLFIEPIVMHCDPPCFYDMTPVRRARWGEVKSWYR